MSSWGQPSSPSSPSMLSMSSASQSKSPSLSRRWRRWTDDNPKWTGGCRGECGGVFVLGDGRRNGRCNVLFMCDVLGFLDQVVAQYLHVPTPAPVLLWENERENCYRSLSVDSSLVHSFSVHIYVNPQMETNSIRKQGFPIWKYSSLPAHFRTVITIWKR